MLQFSHDPEAGTVYVYFTELEEGQASYVMEYPASLLLDAEGQIFGLSVKLDDEVLLSMLDLALEGPYNWLDGERGRLIVRVADEEPARSVRLASVESTLEGDIDVRGCLGLSDEVRNGFNRIRVSFKVQGDAPAEKLREVVERAQARSAVFDMVTHGVPVEVGVVTD